MKISIVTVCLNNAATIEETILSVHGQTHSDREHIVIDGMSRDGTQQIVARHSEKIAVFISEPDNGIYDAMNKGIAKASGEVIGFLNADDVYAHERVLEHVASALSDTMLQAVYADLVYVSNNNPHQIVRYWQSGEYKPNSFSHGWLPAHPTFYARRDLYGRLGKFNTDYRLQADFDLLLRFMEVHRVRTKYVPEIWVRMRTGGATNRSWRNILRGNLEAFRAARANGLGVTPFFLVRKILSRIPQFFSRHD